MIIRVKDIIKKRNKDGKYDEQLIDRCLIIGQKNKLEEKVSSNGNAFASLTLVEANVYYHITIFDKELIDVIKNDIGKDEMIMAICNIQMVHNKFRDCEEEKYTMTSYMSNRRVILDGASSLPVVKHHDKVEDKELDFDANDETFEFDDDDLPF